MSDEQSTRDELSALSYEHPDGYRAHLHSKAIDAILASPVIRRIQAEAWFEGADAAVDGYDLPDASNIHNPYIERGETA